MSNLVHKCCPFRVSWDIIVLSVCPMFFVLNCFMPCRQSDLINQAQAVSGVCEKMSWEWRCTILWSLRMVIYIMVFTGCKEWPKEKRSEIMFLFFVSDMHSRKLQQRLNEKLWLVENYFRTHGGWRSNGLFHYSQCSQNPSKSIDIDLNLTTSTFPTSPPSPSHYHHVMPTLTTRGHLR